MGAANCCIPKKTNDANEAEFYQENNRPINDNYEIEPEQEQMQSEMIYEPSLVQKEINQAFENGQIKENPIQVKAQKNNHIPYWNEYSGNIIDLEYDISEEKSPEIFDYLNSMKMAPNDYLEEAKSYGLEHLFQLAIKNPSTQTPFVSNEGYYYMIRELLSTPSDPEDLLLGIKNHFEEKNLSVEVLLSKSDISNIKEAVWNMFLDNKDNQKQILTEESEYCVVCSLPIPDSNKMNNYFVLLCKANNL